MNIENATVEVESTETKKRPIKRNTPEQKEQLNESIGGHISGDVELGVYRIDPENDFEIKFQTEDSACFDLAGYFKFGDRIKVYQNDGTVNERKVNEYGLILHRGERALIPTGLIFDIPKGYALEFYARSGTSLKLGLVLNNAPAQIDSDYVNQSFLSIGNIGQSQYIASGERIAQAKLVKLVETKIVEIKDAPQQKTSRNGGLGSTGK